MSTPSGAREWVINGKLSTSTRHGSDQPVWIARVPCSTPPEASPRAWLPPVRAVAKSGGGVCIDGLHGMGSRSASWPRFASSAAADVASTDSAPLVRRGSPRVARLCGSLSLSATRLGPSAGTDSDTDLNSDLECRSVSGSDSLLSRACSRHPRMPRRCHSVPSSLGGCAASDSWNATKDCCTGGAEQHIESQVEGEIFCPGATRGEVGELTSGVNYGVKQSAWQQMEAMLCGADWDCLLSALVGSTETGECDWDSWLWSSDWPGDKACTDWGAALAMGPGTSRMRAETSRELVTECSGLAESESARDGDEQDAACFDWLLEEALRLVEDNGSECAADGHDAVVATGSGYNEATESKREGEGEDSETRRQHALEHLVEELAAVIQTERGSGRSGAGGLAVVVTRRSNVWAQWPSTTAVGRSLVQRSVHTVSYVCSRAVRLLFRILMPVVLRGPLVPLVFNRVMAPMLLSPKAVSVLLGDTLAPVFLGRGVARLLTSTPVAKRIWSPDIAPLMLSKSMMQRLLSERVAPLLFSAEIAPLVLSDTVAPLMLSPRVAPLLMTAVPLLLSPDVAPLIFSSTVGPLIFSPSVAPHLFSDTVAPLLLGEEVAPLLFEPRVARLMLSDAVVPHLLSEHVARHMLSPTVAPLVLSERIMKQLMSPELAPLMLRKEVLQVMYSPTFMSRLLSKEVVPLLLTAANAPLLMGPTAAPLVLSRELAPLMYQDHLVELLMTEHVARLLCGPEVGPHLLGEHFGPWLLSDHVAPLMMGPSAAPRLFSEAVAQHMFGAVFGPILLSEQNAPLVFRESFMRVLLSTRVAPLFLGDASVPYLLSDAFASVLFSPRVARLMLQPHVVRYMSAPHVRKLFLRPTVMRHMLRPYVRKLLVNNVVAPAVVSTCTSLWASSKVIAGGMLKALKPWARRRWALASRKVGRSLVRWRRSEVHPTCALVG